MDYTDFNMSFNNLILVMGLVIGAIFAIFSLFYAEFWYRQFVKQTQKHFPSENIEHACMPLKNIITIFIFFLGGFIGTYILPFIIFKNITKIKMVTEDSFLYFAIFCLICSIYWISLNGYTVILTSKRLVFTAPYKTIRRGEFLLSDIKNMEIKKGILNIMFKNNEVFMIAPKKSAIICYEKINNLLKLQQTHNVQFKGD